MSIDRVIRWKDKRPGPELPLIVADYFGTSTGKVFPVREGGMAADLGPSSFPFRRLPEHAHREDQHSHRRRVKLYLGEDYLDVITHQADAFTCAVADGLARCLARYYEADLEMRP